MKTFFAPAHITGFFEIREHNFPVETGSRGAGIVIDSGVETGLIIKDSEKNSLRIFYDGSECQCKTTKSVVSEILKSTCGAFDVEVHHFPKLPLAYGFGLSGAGALGTAFAMNHELELDFNHNQLGQIAHTAEVKNNTGLGDVGPELSRGLVIRVKEGAPGVGRIKSIKFESFVVSFIIGRPLFTKTVLKNSTKRLTINQIGGICMQEFLNDPSPQRFMELSNRFTFESGLAQKNVEKAIKNLEIKGVTAGMNMLGNAIFTLTDEPEKVMKLLNYPAIVSRPLIKDVKSQDEHG
jgi:pantoate kinase